MSKFVIQVNYSQEADSKETSINSTEVNISIISKFNNLRFGLDDIINKLQRQWVYPTEDGMDLLCLATVIYIADTKISRELYSQDSWTREISIILPVYSVENWNIVRNKLTRMLNFLTGDKWTISFVKRTIPLSKPIGELAEPASFDTVTLFSGGMDSLIAAINFLEQKKRVAFISHAGDSYTKNAQKKLISVFNEQYNDNKPTYFDFWTNLDIGVFDKKEKETSTRSRSFLFISFGICALTGMKGVKTLQVPENALIALNVPLDTLRVGSHSTRTTHPFYLHMWNEILDSFGFELNVSNPYWNKTKGEMADECLNKNLLLNAISSSISCSSPQKMRYKSARPQHCGYCVPCIIRRAAMWYAFGINEDPTEYYVDKISRVRDNHAVNEGVQLRSFEYAINRIKEDPSLAKFFIHKSGPLCGGQEYFDELANVYRRGLLEVDSFIKDELRIEDES